MNYRLSKEADNDLINLYLHGFKSFGEAQAEHYYFELEDCIKLLNETPNFLQFFYIILNLSDL